MLPFQDKSSLDGLCGLCIQGYRSFRSLTSFGWEAQIILSKMEIQEYRLQALTQTLGTVQRAADTKSLGLLSQPIYNTLESIKLITTNTGHLRAKYNLKFEIPASSLEDDEGAKLGHPRIIKWLHFDETNMDKLATDLKMLTDVLEQFVALAAGPHKMRPTLISAATILLATSTPRALVILAEASAQEYPELAADARRKLELLAPDSDSAIVSSAPRTTNLFVNDFTVVSFSSAASGADDDRQRQVATVAVTGEVVLLEWQWLPPRSHHWMRVVERLKTASALLKVPCSATLRTLDCAGFTVDLERHRAALIYRFPQGAARRPPTTLFRLLQDADSGSETAGLVPPPTLNDRCALALALAETVFRLHMSGWLHWRISAHNVLFFAAADSESVGTNLQRGLKTPFLTGFAFFGGYERDPMDSRVSALRSERYRHPNYQDAFTSGFNKTHDLYR